ncbi:MAG: alpha-amylase family protein [Planctomycetota bacterium]
MQPLTQVHLDFHTSEHIPDVGARFDKEAFQAGLRSSGVRAINLFAKCHHSWSYYPTSFGCGTHPTLTTDLLGQQIEACHEIGVLCPIYYTVGWSANDAERHPDWCVRNRDGSVRWSETVPADMTDTTPIPPVCWKFLCPTGEYREMMLEQVAEILNRFDVDGMWFDICNLEPCWCDHCRAGMREQGLDENNDDDVAAYTVQKWRSFMADCRKLISNSAPNASTFFNGLCHPTTPDVIHEQQTHFELEDLPTTWGGYDKLPVRARYFRKYGKPMIAMSGKFHTMWGEFGGFKHPDAIQAEALAMVVEGTVCNFGDQLHPSGELDPTTYRNLAPAFEAVSALEPFVRDAEPTANLGVFFSERPTGRCVHGTSANTDDEGVCQMLLEGHVDFDVAHRDGDWSRFDTIVFTGPRCLDEQDAQKVSAFLERGGKALFLGESAWPEDRDEPWFDVGAKRVGVPRFEVDYTALGASLLDTVGDWAASPFLNYEASACVEATDGEVLAGLNEPYFDRTAGAYCSHQNTPPQPDPAGTVAAVQKGPVLLLTHRLGRLYHDHGARVHRALFLAALQRLHTQPMLNVADLPSAARATLRHQPQHGRWVLHLLHTPPLSRGRCEVLEDFPTNAASHAVVRLPNVTTLVAETPDGQAIPVAPGEGGHRVTLPAWRMHQSIILRPA